jgi:hypothetical protein
MHSRCVPQETIMSMHRDTMHRDHQVESSEPGALPTVLWVGAALVAMVVFSYWLGMS